MQSLALSKDVLNFIDEARLIIFCLDETGHISNWNRQIALITGYSSEDLIGSPLKVKHHLYEYVQALGLFSFVPQMLQEVISEKSATRTEFFLRQSLDGQETSNIDLRFSCKSQKSQRCVDIVINTMPLRGCREEIVGVLAIGWDVSEQKRSQRHGGELQTFVDTAHALIFGVDANGLVNEWNNTSAEVMGFSREEMFGGNLVEMYIREEFRASFRQVLDRARLGERIADFELPIFTKDQRRLELILNITPRTDVSGDFVGMLCVGQDITMRRKVEVEKMSLAQELQTFIDTANAPIFGIDANGLVNEWNNKSAEITGFSKAEVLGKNLVEVY
jgi:PAS domain S-box-containing protein